MVAVDETIICRCEEVTLKQLMTTAEQFRCSSRELKLRTRAGMGYCGGRTCRAFIDTVVRHINGIPTQDVVPLKHQPPVRPISFQTLGADRG